MSTERIPVGQGRFTYEVEVGWPQRPVTYTWLEVPAVAVDSRDRVYLFNRGDHPVMVFDPDGTFLFSWGEGLFTRPHGITIGPDDSVYCTDDMGHTVRKFTPDGRLLLTLGTGHPSDTGATSMDFRTIRHAGPPFHYPTNVALDPDGRIFVSDGYGNARVHVFSPKGQLLDSWGHPGADMHGFNIPHGIACSAEGHVYVADRENSRVMIFTDDGEIVAELGDMARPCQVAFDRDGHLFVAELGYKAGMWPGISPQSGDASGGRVSVYSADWALLARWGGGQNPTAPGDFFAPHDIRIDSRGTVYVAEVCMSAGGNRGLVSPDCHTIQKFVPAG